MKASMANDLDAGNRLELDWLAGKVVALGRKYGVPTPGQEAVYAILKPFRMGRVPAAFASMPSSETMA
jgi:2-dehydropantoate 2-reductase